MNKQQSKSNQLMVGDKVTIANRFFDNHGLNRHAIGIGNIASVNNVNQVTVKFMYDARFIQWQINGYIKVAGHYVDMGKPMAVVEINPVYLEKIVKRAKREKKYG